MNDAVPPMRNFRTISHVKVIPETTFLEDWLADEDPEGNSPQANDRYSRERRSRARSRPDAR